MAFVPLTPSARIFKTPDITASMKASVLPLPVPVLTMALRCSVSTRRSEAPVEKKLVLAETPLEPLEVFVADALFVKLSEGVFASEVVGQRHVRAFHQHVGLFDVLLELIAELLVRQPIGAQQKASVLGDEMVDAADDGEAHCVPPIRMSVRNVLSHLSVKWLLCALMPQ
jgi:hypothetical protein